MKEMIFGYADAYGYITVKCQHRSGKQPYFCIPYSNLSELYNTLSRNKVMVPYATIVDYYGTCTLLHLVNGELYETCIDLDRSYCERTIPSKRDHLFYQLQFCDTLQICDEVLNGHPVALKLRDMDVLSELTKK